MIFSGIRRPVSAPVAQCIGAEGLQSLAAQVKAQLQRRGDSLLIPGVGIVDGFASGTYSDSAGATPAVLDDFLGRWVDAGSGGLVFTQTTTPNKPLLTKRVNLMTKTEALTDAVAWSSNTTLAITPSVADPEGGNTAFTITANGPNSRLGQFNLTTDQVIQTFWLRRRTGSGVINTYSGLSYVPLSGVTSEWKQFSVIGATSVPSNYFIIQLVTSGDAVDIWHPDLRPYVAGSALPDYQRINTATDYNTAGFPYRVRFGASQTLSASIPSGSGYADTTIISALPGGQVTLTGQNLSGATMTLGPNLTLFARIIAPNGSSMTAAELGLYQRYMNNLAGVA